MRKLLFISFICPALSGYGQEFELKNDSLVDGGTVAIQLGFVAGEIGGAVFNPPAGYFPLRIKRIQIMWASASLQGADVEQDSILVYTGGNENPPKPILLKQLDSPVLHDGYLNEFDVTTENIVVNKGPFSIGLKFLNPPDIAAGGPSLVTDTDGCQVGKNLIYAIPGGWTNGCMFGIAGDFVIRCICEWVGDVATVNGKVNLEYWSKGTDAGLTASIDIKDNGNVIEHIDAPLAADGSYTFSTRNIGTHDVVLKVAHWLSEKQTGVSLSAATQLDWDLGRNGDTDGTNVIDIRDVNSVFINYASTDGGWVDLDGSGQVNLLDLTLTFIYFGEVGAQ
jgi:hypothetical protein